MAKKTRAAGAVAAKAKATAGTSKARAPKKADTKAKAKAKPKAAPSSKSKAGGKTREIRVRMYRQGLGDCFLLSFPKPEGGEFFILIDCGVILGTPDPVPVMKAVAQDILTTTKGHVDVLVATHEHWDHVSGFDQAKDLFEKLDVVQVWLAWTEDPRNATAQQLRRDRADKLAKLWLGIGQMKTRLQATGDSEEVEEVRRAAEVLSFFGIDPEADPPPSDGFGAAEKATSKTGAAMDWIRQKTKDPRFFTPGDLIELSDAGGVRAYVLGPPTDLTQLRKDLPTRSGQETYEDKMGLAALAATFGVALTGSDGAPNPDFDGSMPFDQKYGIKQDTAAEIEFYREHYFGSGPEDPDAWRRIDNAWTGGAAQFALQLDSDTNNTSLALAFELPDGRVLLFPGDAQVGNWESWHADPKGNPRVWKVEGRDVDAAQLLGRTVLYKVGHHGSHNATLREKGLELMPDDGLTALVPVDEYIAHEKKRWTKMPFNPLMARLKEKTKGRILRADDQQAEDVALDRVRVVDSETLIQVAGSGGKPVKRPLYVDYLLAL